VDVKKSAQSSQNTKKNSVRASGESAAAKQISQHMASQDIRVSHENKIPQSPSAHMRSTQNLESDKRVVDSVPVQESLHIPSQKDPSERELETEREVTFDPHSKKVAMKAVASDGSVMGEVEDEDEGTEEGEQSEKPSENKRVI
jgi:hypothetical protein